MNKPLQSVVIVPLNEAALCPDTECNVVSNMPTCPVCGSETLPLHRITERKAVDNEK